MCSPRPARASSGRVERPGANLRTAMAHGATFVRCDFSGADLRITHLHRVTFEECAFEGANLLHASIAGSRLVDCTFAPGAWDRSIVAHVLVNGAPMAGSAP
ncbi:MAG TPA: pentapeptide repeat-containing protein [Dermatophilaceae bacterium]|nr:pentapeptide repeat-containing protein [Dermatophilaceae bacterium]HOA01162.1 pentapeptide repeat-containing protein [Dermatophilaceae bacterium]HOA59527.1 pentapeptide repeat-containing protein [Dermatophilaceae bacterium]HOI02747.1 pentapeptide repeat-containing protein [Dermatophilaceae bacterium]HOR15262.1 pentapeptide repeat-containing protein [Dermatophilaceae bacterium]